MRRSASAFLALATLLGLTACAAPAPAVFPAGAVADYQLGGAYDPAPDVTVVARDSTERPAADLYSICYVNGFQTQPGVAWPRELILLGDDGAPIVDENWPDENIVDISTSPKREAAAQRQFASIATCADAGYDAVEFDNLDSYTRSRGALTLDDAVQFARLLVTEAHRLGLAAGQKNTGELGDRGRDEIGFNFAIVEECDQFDECASFTAVYGDRVIDIEYTDDVRGSFAAVCDRFALPDTELRDRALTARGGTGFVDRHC